MTTTGARPNPTEAPQTPPSWRTLMAAAWRGYSGHRSSLTGTFAFASAAVIIATVLGKVASFAAGRPLVAVVILEQIVPFFAFGIFFGYAMAMATTLLSGEAPDLRSALRSTRGVGRAVLSAGLLSAIVMVAIITLLYYLPLLFLPLFFGPPFLVQVIATERVSFSVAGMRARELLAGETLRALGALMPIALAAGTLMFVGPNLAAAAAAGLGAGPEQAAAIAARLLVDAVTVGLFAALVYAVFADLVVRKSSPPPAPAPDEEAERPRGPSPHRKKKR
jgi:hypothetical protein